MKECTGTYDTNIEVQEVLGKNKTRKTNKHVNIDDNIKSLGFVRANTPFDLTSDAYLNPHGSGTFAWIRNSENSKLDPDPE